MNQNEFDKQALAGAVARYLRYRNEGETTENAMALVQGTLGFPSDSRLQRDFRREAVVANRDAVASLLEQASHLEAEEAFGGTYADHLRDCELCQDGMQSALWQDGKEPREGDQPA